MLFFSSAESCFILLDNISSTIGCLLRQSPRSFLSYFLLLCSRLLRRNCSLVAPLRLKGACAETLRAGYRSQRRHCAHSPLWPARENLKGQRRCRKPETACARLYIPFLGKREASYSPWIPSCMSSIAPSLQYAVSDNPKPYFPPLQALPCTPSVTFEKWVYCEFYLGNLHSSSLSTALANINPSRALGTALEWPEAKKRAHQVREWGIKVSHF